MILPEHEANPLLAGAGIPTVPMKSVDTLQEAIHAAEDLGYPVALKLSSSRHSHKTDVGGVLLDLAAPADLEKALEKLIELKERLDGQAKIIMEPMVPPGAEFFIGFQLHGQFGPLLSLGFGGTLLELYQDVAFRLLPAKGPDFREMLAELKSWPKLRAGFRNLPAVEERHILALMEKVAAFALSRPGIEELDLNPVVVHPEGAMVLDATVVVDPVFFEDSSKSEGT